MDPAPGLFHNPRIIASSIIALTIIAAAFFSSYTPKKEVAGELVVKDAVLEGIHEDLDSDGLETWQEDMWGTDRNNVDTDGDGTPDGEEVKVGRDPKKKGPKDRKQDAILATTTRYYDDDPSLTTTDVISRDLFSGAAALDKNGELTDANVDIMINALIEKSRGKVEPVPTQRTLSDIRVSQIESPEVYRAYYNGIATIILENSTSSVSDKEMIALWTSTDVTERRALARKEADREKAFADKLLPLIVPMELSQHHLALVNAIYENVVILKRMSEMKGINPINDLFQLEEFQKRIQTIATSLESIFAAPILTKIPWDPNKNEPMAKLAELKLTQ